MSDIPDSDIDEAASEWFALISTGEPSGKEKEEFERWMQESFKHRQAYRELEHIWNTMNQLEPHEYGSHSDISPPSTPASLNHDRWDLVSWFKSIIPSPVVIGSMGLLVLAMFLFSSMIIDDQVGSYTTKTAEVKTLTLPDNSIVELSASSSIEYKFSDDSREVFLTNGQAYFSVKKLYNDRGRPVSFKVYIGESVVEVLGTEFDINLRTASARITLVEGSILVQSNFDSAARYTIEPGQQVIAVGNRYERLNSPTNVDADIMTSWRQGRLTYRNAELFDVIEDVNRFYNGEFIFNHQNLKSLRVTTSFNLDQIQEMTKMLEEILPVKIKQADKNKYYIEPNTTESNNKI